MSDIRLRILHPAILFIAAMSCEMQVEADDRSDFFESRIRPVLLKSCLQCHGDEAKGGLRLDSRESALKGGKSGPAIVPGKPQESLLIKAVSRTHERLKMPPGGPLEARHVRTLVEWIRNGAAWPISPQEFFRSQVQPLLKAKCLSCHSDRPKGELRLDSRAGVIAGGKSGPAVDAQNSSASLLLKVVRHADGVRSMPPAKKERLSDEEVQVLQRWLKNGVAWTETSTGIHITEEQRRFWSFQPVKAPTVPNVDEVFVKLGKAHADASDRISRTDWSVNPIDGFILRRLEAEQLLPVERASAGSLIRRATFDLIGLPPTPDEVSNLEAASQADGSAAWSHLIDRLLASRNYGERWGRHWLDVVRYADTAGDASDFPIPEAVKYRNYVIDSFNKDKPYDQFVREQIAGDLLPSTNDDEHWEQTIGTGYIAISRRIGVSPHGLRHITIEDTIDNVGKTFLGLTISCARCHDHKFDPIPSDDYYALYGIFDSSIYPHAGAEHKPWRQDFVYRIGRDESNRLLKEKRATLEIWNRKERAKLEEYRDFQRKKITDPTKNREKAWQAVLDMREQRRPFAEAFPDLEIAYAVNDGAPHDVHVMKAGDPSQRSRGPLVRRGFLQILGGQKLADDAKGSGRLELAQWITDPKNSLTARVIVNRVWHWHFRSGLVKTTSDFGVRGTPPTHPELLDFLASWFVEHDWSFKQLHRLIMTSQTYQLSSADITENSQVDPQNDLLWRANRRRLDAEQIRDSILAFSGSLDLSPGGRHPFDHRLTYFYRQHEPFVGNFESNRRSVYLMQQRIRKNDYLDLFDGPDGNLPFAERKSTTTTLQALFFMNSEFAHEQTNKIAERVSSSAASTSGRIYFLYETIFGRAPTSQELSRSTALLEQLAAARISSDSDSESRALSGFIRGMISSNEFLFVD